MFGVNDTSPSSYLLYIYTWHGVHVSRNVGFSALLLSREDSRHLLASYTRHTRHRAIRHMSRGWRCKSWKFKRDISFPGRPLISRDLERFAKLLLSRATDGWDMALRRTAVATFFRTEKILSSVLYLTGERCLIFYFFIVSENSVIDEIWILFHLSFIWFCINSIIVGTFILGHNNNNIFLGIWFYKRKYISLITKLVLNLVIFHS